MSIGAKVTSFIDGFIPETLLHDREARTRARMFMFSHTFGPILSSSIPGYLLFVDPASVWKLLLLSGCILCFWIYPFVLKRTGRYDILCYASIQNLLLAIILGCYFYGGLSSPFLPWLATVPLLAFFYLSATLVSCVTVSIQIAISLVVFSVALKTYGLPSSIALENMAVPGVISIACSAIYVSMMALYYAGILASQREFEEEARRHVETSNELREAVQRAERASAAKAEFLARTSHELRTPLNAVIGFSEVLLEETDPGAEPQAVEDLRKIHSAGRHLLNLVNAILDLSKIEAGRMEVFPDRYPLAQVIAQSVERWKTMRGADDSEIWLNVAPSAGDICADAPKLEQTIHLLLDNACKYAAGSGIEILAKSATLASGEDGVAIVVRDRGRGIEPQLLPTLFDTFSEGQNIQHAQRGPGLGLPLARRLCQLMRGDLHVEETGPQGTSMKIELPRVYAAPEQAAAA